MKSIGFQRNKTLIRVVDEKQLKKRRNWDRIVYFVLLSGFLLFIGYYLFERWFFVNAYGHVITESTRVRLTNDARILQFYAAEGDSIQLGDTLFSYALNIENPSLTRDSSFTNTSELWYEKESYQLNKTIHLNAIKIKENEKIFAALQQEHAHLTNAVILGAIPKSRLDGVQSEMTRIQSENVTLISENNVLNTIIKDFPQPAAPGKINSSDERLSDEHFFKAPTGGIITHIYIHKTETALKSEDILSIHQDGNAYIKVFFDEKDLHHLRAGDVFSIRFPDGSSGTGILKRYYTATYALPDEFQKRYESAARCIAGDIYPENTEEAKKWKVFYKMKVDISKFKY